MLLAKGPILYKEKNEILTGISIWLRFDEVFKAKENQIDYDQLVDINGAIKYYHEFVNVSFNNKTKQFDYNAHEQVEKNYSMVRFTKDILQNQKSDISKEIDKIVNFEAPMSEVVEIDSEEFLSIIDNYGRLFENDNSLQTTTYSCSTQKIDF